MITIHSESCILQSILIAALFLISLVLATAKSGKNVKLNGEQTPDATITNTEGAYYQLAPIAITAGTQYQLTKGSAESIVMLIILEPVE